MNKPRKNPPFARVKLSIAVHRKFMSKLAANGDTAQLILLEAVDNYVLEPGDPVEPEDQWHDGDPEAGR